MQRGVKGACGVQIGQHLRKWEPASGGCPAPAGLQYGGLESGTPKWLKKDSHAPARAQLAHECVACAAGVLRDSKALKLKGTRSPTLRNCRAARILSCQPQLHLPYPQLTLHQFPSLQQLPLTALGPPLLQTSQSQSQPGAQPSRLSLVATCCKVCFCSQGRGSGALTLATVRCPGRRLPRALCFKHPNGICRAPANGNGMNFLDNLFLSTFPPVDPVSQSQHIYLCGRKDQARFYKAHSRSLVYQGTASQLRRI